MKVEVTTHGAIAGDVYGVGNSHSVANNDACKMLRVRHIMACVCAITRVGDVAGCSMV